MRKGWEIKKLGEFCELSAGGDVPKNAFSEIETDDYNIPIFANGEKDNGLYGYTNIPKVTKPSITISARGTIGYSVKRLNCFYPIVRLIVVTPKQDQKLDLSFLYYALNKTDFKHSGTSIPQLTVPMIREYEIPIPPLPEQQRIVAILEEAFVAIDQAKANTEKNLQNAKELFQSELNSIFTNKGEGWVEKKLLDVCNLKSGTTISEKLEKVKGEIAYLKVADMNIVGNENRVSTSSRFLDMRDFNVKNIFPVGTIIFPKRGGAIATNKKRITDIPICADLNIMGAIALPIIDSEFLFYFFKKFNLIDIANGTTILQINNYSFEPITISFPKSLVDQQRIVDQLNSLSEETKQLEVNYQKKLEGLEELKKSILQKAFSGELTRQTAEIEMEQLDLVAEEQAKYQS